MKNERIECDCNIIHKKVVDEILEILPEDAVLSSLADLFKILSDGTRVKIVWMLNKREMCVCDIANVLNMTKSRVSHQLAILRDSGILKARRDGREVYYELDDNHVRKLYTLAFLHVNHKKK